MVMDWKTVASTFAIDYAGLDEGRKSSDSREFGRWGTEGGGKLPEKCRCSRRRGVVTRIMTRILFK